MSKEAVLNKIKDVGIVAVIRAESVEQAAKITDACVAGGVTTVELCFTVPNADQLISQMVKKYEGTDVTIGAGTVLDPATARIAILNGAQYIVSPHFDPEIIALGGGVSKAGDFLLKPLREKVAKYVFYKDLPYAKIEIATLGSDAGIIGAAMLGK